MVTAQTKAATEQELQMLADYGASLAELLDHLDEHKRRLGIGTFSDDQEEELQLYCWALHKDRSSGRALGATAVWGSEDDIGA